MSGRCDSVLSALLLVLLLAVTVMAQESVNAAAGINVGMHAGLAILISFSILGSCAIGINIVSRFCGKKLAAA